MSYAIFVYIRRLFTYQRFKLGLGATHSGIIRSSVIFVYFIWPPEARSSAIFLYVWCHFRSRGQWPRRNVSLRHFLSQVSPLLPAKEVPPKCLAAERKRPWRLLTSRSTHPRPPTTFISNTVHCTHFRRFKQSVLLLRGFRYRQLPMPVWRQRFGDLSLTLKRCLL